MTRGFRFEFLLQRAIERRDMAAQGIGAATQRLEAARERQTQIESYRAEYRLRFTDTAMRGMPVHQLHDFQLFLAKLDTAVEQQVFEVSRHIVMLEEAKRVWFDCEKEVKAFEALRVRHVARVNANEVRTEQKMADEWAANLHRRGKAEG
jgi:flagellar FliJ protein